MPLVRIAVLKGRDGFGRQVGEVVYRTMVDTIDVPRDDNFLVISEHTPDTLVFDRTYMGIARSSAAPSAVRSTWRVPRENTAAPSSSSRLLICRLTADCVRKSSSPALVNDRWRAADSKPTSRSSAGKA